MTAPARVTVRTMNKGTPREFERVFSHCPNGHEMTSAPAGTRTGRTLAAGDLSEEWCGYGRCEYGAGLVGVPVLVAT